MIEKVAKPETLTAAEKSRLSELEATVEKHIGGFREAGAALAEIRDKRLYRATHETFETYLSGVWSMSRRRGYQLIDAAEVVARVCTTGTHPATEREARPLTKLPPEEQADAFAEAVATAPNGKPTAAHVAEVVKRRTAPDVTFGSINTDDEPTARDDSTDADDDEAERKAAGRAYVDNAPFAALAEHDTAVAQMKALGKTPQQEADEDPGRRWAAAVHKLYVFMNSTRDAGGIKQLAREWPKASRKEHAAELRRIAGEIEKWIQTLEGK